ITQKVIKEYYIECDTNDFINIYQNFKENNYIPIKITYNGESRIARMRIRGDTSRKDPKKSLKIKFDSLLINNIPKVVNLNAEYADKTYIRQYLSNKLMQKSGQICFNAEHVKVFVNGTFHGLYLQVENMDKDFLKRNNLSKKGNLYKATKDGACLSVFDNFNAKWEKKTNKKSDHNDLTELIHNLNSVSDNDFHKFVKTTFEYDKLINLLALNMFLSNNSTYYHNYYLYHDLYNTGKWQMIPWDLDKTMSYYNWMPYTYHKTSSEWESDNPLVERAILCPPMFNDIKKRIDELHKSGLNNLALNPIVDSLIAELSDIIPLDTTDKIESVKEWKTYANNEKSYFDKHYKLLQQQFNEQPLSFNVFRLDKIQTDIVTFKWQKSIHPTNKNITYIVSYGTDFLLTDSSKTKYITNISDTFYTLKTHLPEGIYYWKITAFDGKYYTDGFNTKNVLEVKKGTKLPTTISKNTTLKKENSPYIINKNTTINPGITLTIDPGVNVCLKQDVNISCYGNIIANGTSTNLITFMPDNTAKNWGHIYFYKPSKQGYLKNVLFKEGTINSKSEVLTLDSCSILIDEKFMGDGWSNRKVLIYSGEGIVHINNSTFIGNGEGEGLVFFHGEATVENSYFENVPDAIEYIQMNKGIIRNNMVITSPDDAIDLNACNNILIEKNILMNNIDKAISIGTEQYGASLKNIQIKNNLMVGNKTAIAIKDSSVAYISNNTLFKNISGINAYKKRDDYDVGGTAYVKNTIFEKNEKTNAYPDKWSSITVINSIVNNKVLAGKNNFQGDPKFIDAKGNNFHLRKESPCLDKGDDKKDIGAFNSEGTTVSFSQIHIKSSEEKNTGDWVELFNNYNIPVDLSLYRIVIENNEEKKEFVFPIGTTLKRMATVTIANKYFLFTKVYGAHNLVLGGLPKLNTGKTTLKLINPSGYVIDSTTFSAISNKKESITFVSNRKNEKRNKSWKLIVD
ncbi:MAG: CotH kinase family protein, partial [Flavobacteriales bacterium]|nr:CotH kinase family protein [Flavobacteriales bacterium]